MRVTHLKTKVLLLVNDHILIFTLLHTYLHTYTCKQLRVCIGHGIAWLKIFEFILVTEAYRAFCS